MIKFHINVLHYDLGFIIKVLHYYKGYDKLCYTMTRGRYIMTMGQYCLHRLG